MYDEKSGRVQLSRISRFHPPLGSLPTALFFFFFFFCSVISFVSPAPPRGPPVSSSCYLSYSVIPSLPINVLLLVPRGQTIYTFSFLFLRFAAPHPLPGRERSFSLLPPPLNFHPFLSTRLLLVARSGTKTLSIRHTFRIVRAAPETFESLFHFFFFFFFLVFFPYSGNL